MSIDSAPGEDENYHRHSVVVWLLHEPKGESYSFGRQVKLPFPPALGFTINLADLGLVTIDAIGFVEDPQGTEAIPLVRLEGLEWVGEESFIVHGWRRIERIPNH